MYNNDEEYIRNPDPVTRCRLTDYYDNEPENNSNTNTIISEKETEISLINKQIAEQELLDIEESIIQEIIRMSKLDEKEDITSSEKSKKEDYNETIIQETMKKSEKEINLEEIELIKISKSETLNEIHNLLPRIKLILNSSELVLFTNLEINIDQYINSIEKFIYISKIDYDFIEWLCTKTFFSKYKNKKILKEIFTLIDNIICK